MPSQYATFPLHVDQMEELGLENIFQYATVMAETLAFLYWVAHIDANDVEFVLAPSTQQGQVSKLFLCSFLGQHTMWLLDFDCCKPMAMDEEGVSQAVAAFYGNDRFYPRPDLSHPRDQQLWEHFHRSFFQFSARFLEHENEEMRALPELFTRKVGVRGIEEAVRDSQLNRD